MIHVLGYICPFDNRCFLYGRIMNSFVMNNLVMNSFVMNSLVMNSFVMNSLVMNSFVVNSEFINCPFIKCILSAVLSCYIFLFSTVMNSIIFLY